MSSQSSNKHHQTFLKYLIKRYCRFKLSFKKTLHIDGQLCVFTDAQLAFSIRLDDDFRRDKIVSKNLVKRPKKLEKTSSKDRNSHSKSNDTQKTATKPEKSPTKSPYQTRRSKQNGDIALIAANLVIKTEPEIKIEIVEDDPAQEITLSQESARENGPKEASRPTQKPNPPRKLAASPTTKRVSTFSPTKAKANSRSSGNDPVNRRLALNDGHQHNEGNFNHAL